MKKNLHLFLISLFTFQALVAQEPSESDFYTETIHLVDETVNLVIDYGANTTDLVDDTQTLQQAIDDMHVLPNGGKIIIPKGLYQFMGVYVKSNVHLVIDSEAVIYAGPKSWDNGIFLLGLGDRNTEAIETVRNVSVRSNNGEKFKVDLSGFSIGVNVKVVNCKNVNNFLISDINVSDNWTKISCITLNLAEYYNEVTDTYYAFGPENGVIKNCTNTNSHPGYGMIQQQLGKNIFYKNLSGGFGNTLRMESGAGHGKYGFEHDLITEEIYARDLSCTDGGCVLSLNPHTRKNGHVDIRRLTSYGCRFGAYIVSGFTNTEDEEAGRTPGSYANTSIVADVHGVYGSQAYSAPRFHKYIPCELRHLISSESTPEGVHYYTPSAATICDRASDRSDEEGGYQVNFSNITQEGFQYQAKTIIGDNDSVKDGNCPVTNVSQTEHFEFSIYPNPVFDKVYITKPFRSKVDIIHLSGSIIKQINCEDEEISMDLGQLKSGLYFIQVSSANDIVVESFIKK